MSKRIWEIFPKLAEAVWKTHEEVGLYGHHDLLHAYRVGDVAYRIGCDEYDERVGEFAGAAGLCHNADRILQKKHGIGRREVNQEEIREIIRSWTFNESFFLDTGHPPGTMHDDLNYGRASNEVVDAVLGHDGRNNEKGKDSEILICLMDADRVVNCRPELIMRSAQYYHDLPTVDPIHFDQDPTANYRNPKTVLKDLMMSSLELAEEGTPVSVRTRLGKQLINDPDIGAPFFRRYLELLKLSLEKEGLQPWPFEFSPMPPEPAEKVAS